MYNSTPLLDGITAHGLDVNKPQINMMSSKLIWRVTPMRLKRFGPPDQNALGKAANRRLFSNRVHR
jgi:hypothetical protein